MLMSQLLHIFFRLSEVGINVAYLQPFAHLLFFRSPYSSNLISRLFGFIIAKILLCLLSLLFDTEKLYIGKCYFFC